MPGLRYQEHHEGDQRGEQGTQDTGEQARGQRGHDEVGKQRFGKHRRGTDESGRDGGFDEWAVSEQPCVGHRQAHDAREDRQRDQVGTWHRFLGQQAQDSAEGQGAQPDHGNDGLRRVQGGPESSERQLRVHEG